MAWHPTTLGATLLILALVAGCLQEPAESEQTGSDVNDQGAYEDVNPANIDNGTLNNTRAGTPSPATTPTAPTPTGGSPASGLESGLGAGPAPAPLTG